MERARIELVLFVLKLLVDLARLGILVCSVGASRRYAVKIWI